LQLPVAQFVNSTNSNKNIERSEPAPESLASQQQRLKVTAGRNLTDVYIQLSDVSAAGCTVCAG
jgi:hypothetical protein